jgi:CHAT domain-containing protein
MRIYERLHDRERIVATHTRRIGVLRVAGQLDQGWREARETCFKLGQVVAIGERNLLLGETSRLALALGHPKAALRYADVAVSLIEQELTTTLPDRLAAIKWLQHNLGIAKRRRAGFELQVDLRKAQADLSDAVHLAELKEDSELRRSLEARIAEVRAQLSMRSDPARAVTEFSSAIALSENIEYRSFRASLYAQRAAGQHEAGRLNEAQQDLRNALAELDAEESNLLANRKETDFEKILWNDYFSRFQETYHELIRQLIPNHAGEAFRYADRARAFEPLNLALKLTPTDAAPVDIAQVQKLLPAGTFLIEYTVLEDRTFAWVITRATWQSLTLETGRATIRRWSDELQAGVKARDLTAIETALFAAYDELLTAPMAVIQHMPASAAPRLVIVPDGTMEGIPFAALHNPVSHRYLIQDAPVSMAGSAALYALSVKRDRELKRDTSALLFGLLPYAEKEVELIAKQYAPHAIVRTGTEATAEDFIARAGENAIVHVGAHAIIDPRAPSHSKLIFASSELDATQLLARLNPVRTRIVVLGACSSAGGLPVGPQGVAPLVRPLIARGVPAVVGTLWDVDDATAAELLVSFHQHYGEGNDAAAAMQLAQIELLSKDVDVLRSVLAWAPYQVIGYGSSPFAAPRH